jgi:hypothetical protein
MRQNGSYIGFAEVNFYQKRENFFGKLYICIIKSFQLTLAYKLYRGENHGPTEVTDKLCHM